MIVIVLAIVGLGGIVAGIFASRSGARRAANAASEAFSRRLRIARWLGYALAIASFPLTGLMSYPLADDAGRPGHVAGIPFAAAYFDAQGRDYVGLITFIAVVGNAFFWALLPRVVVVCIDVAGQLRRRGADEDRPAP